MELLKTLPVIYVGTITERHESMTSFHDARINRALKKSNQFFPATFMGEGCHFCRWSLSYDLITSNTNLLKIFPDFTKKKEGRGNSR